MSATRSTIPASPDHRESTPCLTSGKSLSQSATSKQIQASHWTTPSSLSSLLHRLRHHHLVSTLRCKPYLPPRDRLRSGAVLHLLLDRTHEGSILHRFCVQSIKVQFCTGFSIECSRVQFHTHFCGQIIKVQFYTCFWIKCIQVQFHTRFVYNA